MVAPKPIREVKPDYTRSLMRARAQDVVLGEIVVAADGTIADARVIHGRYPEMNDQALKALWQWQFEAGTLNVAAVPTIALVQLTFTLR